MARKQETPVPAADPKDPVIATDPAAGQSEGGSSPGSSGGKISANSGEAVPSGAAPESTETAAPQLGEDQATSNLIASLSTEGLATSAVTPNLTAIGPEVAAQAGTPEAETAKAADQPRAVEQAAIKPNPTSVLVYPLRSYMDEGELRRRGGPAYTVPRRHAEELLQRKLASLEPLKE